MKSKQSKTARENWNLLKDNIVKKTPNFLISNSNNTVKNTVKITKSHDSEIIINCDDDKHETIPDSVFNYLCNLNTNLDSKIIKHNEDKNNKTPKYNVLEHEVNPTDVDAKKSKRKTKSSKPKIGGKKTRKKKTLN